MCSPHRRSTWSRRRHQYNVTTTLALRTSTSAVVCLPPPLGRAVHLRTAVDGARRFSPFYAPCCSHARSPDGQGVRRGALPRWAVERLAQHQTSRRVSSQEKTVRHCLGIFPVILHWLLVEKGERRSRIQGLERRARPGPGRLRLLASSCDRDAKLEQMHVR